MSYVVAVPNILAATATDVAGIGSSLRAAHAAAAAPTTSLVAAAEDEVSTGIAAWFSDYAQQYQALGAKATLFHDQFVQLLNGGAAQYVSAEIANANPLQGIEQQLINTINAPAVALTGRPLIGNGANGAAGNGPNGAPDGTNGSNGLSGQTTSQGLSAAGNTGSPAAASSSTTAAASSAGASSSAGQNPVTATIPTGGGSLASVPNGPHGSDVYVATGSPAGNGTVSVIDTSTNKVVATIPVGIDPFNIVAAPDGNHVYLDGYTTSGSNAVVAINTATNSASAPIPLTGNYGAGTMAITPNGSRLYVPDTSGGTVSVINTATDTVVGQPITLPGSTVDHLVITPDGKSVYVDGFDSSNNLSRVSVINTATNTVTATIPVDGTAPTGNLLSPMVMSPDGKYVYVTTHDQSGLSSINTIDTATYTTVGKPITGYFDGVLISPDGHYLYAAYGDGYSTSTGGLSVIDTTTHTVTSAIPLNGRVIEELGVGMALSPDGHNLYANVASPSSNGYDGTVTVMNTTNRTFSNPIQTNPNFNPVDEIPNPTAIAFAPNGLAYVSNVYSNTTSVIDPSLISFHAPTGGNPPPAPFDPISWIEQQLVNGRNLLNSNLAWPLNWGTVLGYIPGVGQAEPLIDSLGLLFDPSISPADKIIEVSHSLNDLGGGLVKGLSLREVAGIVHFNPELYLAGVATQQWGDVQNQLQQAFNNGPTGFQNTVNYAVQHPYDAAVAGSQAVVNYLPKLVSNLLPPIKLW